MALIVSLGVIVSASSCAGGTNSEPVIGTEASPPGNPADESRPPDDDGLWQVTERTREDYLRGIAVITRIEDPPDVPVIREVTPEEVPSLVDACMAEVGWPPREPGTWMDIPESQQESFNLAWYICYAQYPVKVELNQEVTPSQVRFIRQ
ncbi:MAG: hypothetical protein LBH13_09525 [Cellulomonadaceae bacterium]|nr:hypothetical protein [Cellulomonadaceae bacterium]